MICYKNHLHNSYICFLTGLYEQFLDDLRNSSEKRDRSANASPSSPSASRGRDSFSSPGLGLGPSLGLRLKTGTGQGRASIPPDTYVVTAHTNMRQPDPEEEVRLAPKNKLHVQQQHHHQFGQGVSLLGIDDLRPKQNPNQSSSSSLTSLHIDSSGLVETFNESGKSINGYNSLPSGSHQAVHKSPKSTNTPQPQVFDEKFVDRERNRVYPDLAATTLPEPDAMELDPFLKEMMKKIKRNNDRKKKSSASIASAMSPLHSVNTLSTSGGDSDELYSLDSDKRNVLLSRTLPPPLHQLAESFATVDEQQWIDFLENQKKLSFASFSAIDYIDSKG